jgi:hypothetical protein
MLTEKDLRQWNFTRNDKWDQILVTYRTPMEVWSTSSRHAPGPVHSRLRDDNLDVGLTNLDMTVVVHWYGKLAPTILPMNVALIPFDAIEIGHGHIGLCPPGVGTLKYWSMASALFDLLARSLPKDLQDLDFWITLHQDSDQDGYRLLHHVFTISLPGFSPTITLSYPAWSDYDSIPGYASAAFTYYRLLHKTGQVTTARDQSLTFLKGIRHPSLLGILEVYTHRIPQNAKPDGSLPIELQIQTLAVRLSEVA